MPTASPETEISAADSGSGKPLVLIHGFPVDRRMWDGQIAGLRDRNRVVAPDLPGFGASPGESPFTIESLADELHEWLKKIGILPCALAALSMGGYIALAFARKYQADLLSLILIDTRAEADAAEQKEGRQKMIDLVRSKGATAIADQMLPRLLAPDTPRNRPGVAQSLRGMMEACAPLTIAHALAAMRDRPDQTPHLESINVPALIIVGDQDVITPLSAAERMQRGIPSAGLTVITGAGHMAPMEQPSQVNRAISRFLDARGI